MEKFKIGVVNLGYETNETLADSLAAWGRIKKDHLLSDLIESVFVAAEYGCFKITHAMGYPIKCQDGTVETYQALAESKVIDNLAVNLTHTIEETPAWTRLIQRCVAAGCDYVWMNNSDEIPTVEEIERVLKFVKKNEFIDYFKFTFKNFIFDGNHFSRDFVTPRLFRVNCNGGLVKSDKDDLFSWKYKSHAEAAGLTIPENVAFIKHLSWCGSPSKLKRKAEFSRKYYSMASFLWNEEKQKLEFNDEYYKHTGKQKPEVFTD